MTRWSKLGLAMSIAALAMVDAASAEVTLEQAQQECHSTAQQQTGYNPSAPATAPQGGGRLKGAAAGAMAGAAHGKAKSNQYGNVPNDIAEE